MSVSHEYYKNLAAEELLMDDFFIESVNNPDTGSITFWEEFVAQYPEKKKVFDEAVLLVQGLKFRLNTPPPSAKQRIWDEVMSQAGAETKVVNMPRRRWIWAAASITLIAFAATAIILFQGGSKKTISTQFSEIRQISLPDQSVVTLNANSSLEYKKNWKAGEPREVWLKGEAFFEVKHLNQAGRSVKEEEKFIVHAGQMNVHVLGTSFTVTNIHSLIEVSLQEGSVKIDFDDNNKEEIILVPGEKIKYNPDSKQVEKETSAATPEVLWKNKELKLENMSIGDLLNRIGHYYGYEIEMEDKNLLNRQVSGAGASKLSLGDEEALLKSLELMFPIEIIKKEKTLYIKNK